MLGAMRGFVSVGVVAAVAAVSCQAPPAFEFGSQRAVSEWTALHDVATPTFEGGAMRLTILGPDPYLEGPARDYPANRPLLLKVRLRSEQGGTMQVFFAGREQGFAEPRSARCGVPAGKWFEASMRLPALGRGVRLRLDPPGAGGVCDVAWMRFGLAPSMPAPKWPQPRVPAVGETPYRISNGAVELVHSRARYGAFKLFVDGTLMACGNDVPMVGFTAKSVGSWATPKRSRVWREGGAIVAEAVLSSPRGAVWTLRQRFSKSAHRDAIDVRASAVPSVGADVHYAPLVVLHPGLGSYGESHGQAVFPGLEYLDRDEPSSSEKDLRGEQAQRLAPDTVRITVPMMAIQEDGRVLSLAWKPSEAIAAMFDMPDRQMESDSHLMGLLAPGSDGFNRREGSLTADLGLPVAKGQAVTVEARLTGVRGESCVPALQRYVEQFGLPKAPASPYAREAYAKWAAEGWLSSGVHSGGGRYRHAFWPGIDSFGPGLAPDAGTFMVWLSEACGDPELASRLDAASEEAVRACPPGELDTAGVSHVRYPVQSLLFGDPLLSAARAVERGKAALTQFEPDGRVLYRPSAGKLDFGRTHFAPDANGLTAQAVLGVLEAALATGDPMLRKRGLEVLQALGKFLNTAPRGAQTWEVPLHTPDILASAHLVRCYTIGYELTGDAAMLDKARHWAWTGVPFVYLRPPTPEPVGLYATIAVFGATNWEAPNWMGLPVQWCGLVYSDALYRLARHDPRGIWKTLADGIAVSGMQQSFPALAGDLQGLLPDSFNLRSQTRNAVAINPGTLQANAVRYLGGPPLYDYRVLRSLGTIVHAPGEIAVESADASQIVLRVRTWTSRPYRVLAVGLPAGASIAATGRAVSADASGRAVVEASGDARITILTGR